MLVMWTVGIVKKGMINGWEDRAARPEPDHAAGIGGRVSP